MNNPTTARDMTDLSNFNKLIIGLDFGTTYSGIAYIFTGFGKSSQPIVIKEWPGQPNINSNWFKVPSSICYEESLDVSCQWGYELDHSAAATKVEGIKLLLDPDHPKPLYVPHSNMKAELKRLGKPPIDVATDYITALCNYASSVIRASHSSPQFQTLQVEYVLSVPAVWSDKAKNSTMHVCISL